VWVSVGPWANFSHALLPERPVTCEIGTNRLVRPEREPLREAITDLLEKPRKQGMLPPLWDGKAAERIVDTIVKQIL